MARVLIDMDGTVTDLLNPWVTVYNERFHQELSVDEITEYEIGNFVPPGMVDNVYSIIKEPGFFNSLPILPGALDGVTKLHKLGFEIRFSTIAPTPHGAAEKIVWIERHFGHLGYDVRHVILGKDKHWLDADVLIDDNPTIMNNWLDKPDDPYGVAIEHPYNQELRERASLYAPSYRDTEKAWDIISTYMDWYIK